MIIFTIYLRIRIWYIYNIFRNLINTPNKFLKIILFQSVYIPFLFNYPTVRVYNRIKLLVPIHLFSKKNVKRKKTNQCKLTKILKILYLYTNTNHNPKHRKIVIIIFK